MHGTNEFRLGGIHEQDVRISGLPGNRCPFLLHDSGKVEGSKRDLAVVVLSAQLPSVAHEPIFEGAWEACSVFLPPDRVTSSHRCSCNRSFPQSSLGGLDVNDKLNHERAQETCRVFRPPDIVNFYFNARGTGGFTIVTFLGWTGRKRQPAVDARGEDLPSVSHKRMHDNAWQSWRVFLPPDPVDSTLQ